MLTFTITVRPLGRSRYEVYHGENLLCVSTEPLLDASRILLERGWANTRDRIEMWHEDASFAALRGVIGKAARLTVVETAQGPVFRKVDRKPVKTPVGKRNEMPRYTPTFA